jgi:hypothetical protein
MLTAPGSIATQQSNPTKNTMIKVEQFLDYAFTHPDAIVTYQASEMVLAANSDALEAKARSQAGGHFFMSSNTPCPHNNGAILTIAQIIMAVMSLAAEAKIGALYIKCREAVPACHTLEFLGHPQPPTPIQTHNTMALGVVNNNIMKKLKDMDMKYHWLWDRFSQKHSNATGHRATKTTPLFIIRLCGQLFSPALSLCKHSITGSQISFLQQGCARHIHMGIIKVPTVSTFCYTHLQVAWQTEGQRHSTTQLPCVTSNVTHMSLYFSQ